MDSITVGCEQQSPGKVQFLSNPQRFRQYSTRIINSHEKKSNTKKVAFNLGTPTVLQEAFENTEIDHSGTVRSQRQLFEDHDYMLSSSSTNIFASELPTIPDKRICSVRASVVTFIIVIVIITVTAIAVGIVFGTIKSSQANVTGTTKPSLFSTVSTTVIMSSVSIGSQSGLPCLSYTTINDPSRNVAQSTTYGTCDRGPLFNMTDGGSWIRFVGTGGTTIPVSNPGSGHCGGFSSGWYNGTVPTIFGDRTNGTVCFDTNSVPCMAEIDVSVVYCTGSFYVYLLPSVMICNARYCTI